MDTKVLLISYNGVISYLAFWPHTRWIHSKTQKISCFFLYFVFLTNFCFYFLCHGDTCNRTHIGAVTYVIVFLMNITYVIVTPNTISFLSFCVSWYLLTTNWYRINPILFFLVKQLKKWTIWIMLMKH